MSRINKVDTIVLNNYLCSAAGCNRESCIFVYPRKKSRNLYILNEKIPQHCAARHSDMGIISDYNQGCV